MILTPLRPILAAAALLGLLAACAEERAAASGKPVPGFGPPISGLDGGMRAAPASRN
jgi:hypothetical protein